MSRPSKIAIVKELGSRTPRCLAAHAVRGNDEPELVVVERYPAALGADVLAVIEEDTKELSTLDHTNIATLIATVKLKGDVAVLSEWVDGESLSSIFTSPQKPSFEVLLRMLADVLEAMSALHATGEGRVCGALTPDDVFAGVDGVTRIARFGLGRVAPDVLGKSRLGYMAPEFARGERTARGDVYTAGVLFWEAFTGDLFERAEGAEAPRVDASKRDESVAGIADVIAKALAVDPQARYATARDMLSAVTASAKLAPRAAVSQYVARAFGEKIDARIVKLEPKVDVSLSMTPTATTEPPPAIEAKSPKAPEISAAPIAAPAPAPAPTPKAAEIKPIETKPKIDSTPRLPTTPRKPTASTPDATVTAKPAEQAPRKAVPLPLPKKSLNQPDSAPNLIAAARTPEVAPKITPQAITPTKTNGATPAPAPAKTPTKSANIVKAAPVDAAPKAAVVEPAVAPMPSVLVDFDSEPPPSSNELDDVDVVSVRPPPMAAKKAPKEEPKPEPQQEPRVVTKSVRAPAREAVEARAAAVEEEPAPQKSSGRGLLMFLVGVMLFCGGFFAGRFTSQPEAQPPAPMPTTSVAPPLSREAVTTTAPLPTTTIDAGAAVLHPTTEKPITTPTRVADSPLDASTRDAGRYEPHGI